MPDASALSSLIYINKRLRRGITSESRRSRRLFKKENRNVIAADRVIRCMIRRILIDAATTDPRQAAKSAATIFAIGKKQTTAGRSRRELLIMCEAPLALCFYQRARRARST